MFTAMKLGFKGLLHITQSQGILLEGGAQHNSFNIYRPCCNYSNFFGHSLLCA
jgi:hypothetical protein